MTEKDKLTFRKPLAPKGDDAECSVAYNAQPRMIPYNIEKKKWDMHDTFLRVMC